VEGKEWVAPEVVGSVGLEGSEGSEGLVEEVGFARWSQRLYTCVPAAAHDTARRS